MPSARQALLLFLAAYVFAPRLAAQSAPSVPEASAASLAPDLATYRALIDDSKAARAAGDYDSARAMASEAVTYLLALPEAEQDPAWLELLGFAGAAAYNAQDLLTASAAWKRLYEARSATLADDDPGLQQLRDALGKTLYMLGDLAAARVFQEKLLEIALRTLPDDHPELQMARETLSNTLADLGELAAARVLEEKVLEVRTRTLPDNHPDLQSIRQNLGVTLRALGDLAGARVLQEKALEMRSRSLPEDDPNLQASRRNLANVLLDLGEMAGARALREKVLEVYSRTLPDEALDLLRARQDLASVLLDLGDMAGARALREKVLEVLSRLLPEDAPDLLQARQDLARILGEQGDLASSRTLFEKVYQMRLRTLSEEDPALQGARQNLGITLYMLGDLAGARALEEKALAVCSRTLPDDHPYLLNARQNLAATLLAQGDLTGARALFEQSYETCVRKLPDDHPDLQDARQNLAATLYRLGDLAGARALQEKALEVCARKLPADSSRLQAAREGLAGTIMALGDFQGARTLYEKVLEVRARTLPDDHIDVQIARQNLAQAIARELAREARSARGESRRTSARESCEALIGAVCRAQVQATRAAILWSPSREAEERCSSRATTFDVSSSFAQGYGVFEPLHTLHAPVFVLAETTRGAAIASAELARQAAKAPRYRELRERLRAASHALAGLVEKGTTSEEFDRARVEREALERELVELARELAGREESRAEFEVDALAARLAASEAAVSFRRFTKSTPYLDGELDSTGQPAVLESQVDSLCAFVVRSSRTGPGGLAPGAALTLIDLGPIARIEAATRAWRAAIGASLERGVALTDATVDRAQARGAELRRLVFDPLLPALGAADHVVVVLDDVLHLVPLEALPLEDSGELVGDRWHIGVRATLTELLADSPTPSGTALVALGGASFNLEPVALSGADVATISEAAASAEERPVQVASVLRGTAWERGFAPLTHTSDEARGIGALYREIYEGERPALVLEKRKASREALEELAPQARFLHLATHGWFAPESIRSWTDPEPLDKQSGLGARLSGAEQVRGMSPMLLCGLALAGANLPEGANGRAPGLVTAEELSTLDLSNCELVVLSACDTNVGERRAGQGVASFQKALQMAGARSVITSLWKVPDEATKELMLDFYRRLWVEKKQKSVALWEAKKKLREAKDERGEPLYTTRDWAAWVLTGDPN